MEKTSIPIKNSKHFATGELQDNKSNCKEKDDLFILWSSHKFYEYFVNNNLIEE